jgi:hypothetical protein
MDSTQILHFEQSEVDLVNRFCEKLNLGLGVEYVGTWGEPNDALNLCEYVLVRDTKTHITLYHITSTPGSLYIQPEQIETKVGEYATLELALVGLAEEVVRSAASVFFEDRRCENLDD